MKTILLGLFISWPVLAVDTLDLENWISKEIQNQQQVLTKATETQQQNGYSSSFSTLRVRLRGTYGVEIPLLTKGKIRPEIEIYWTP